MNKVKFNLKNVHWALVTFSGNTPTFGTVQSWPGAVSMTLSKNGDTEVFKADGVHYYGVTDNEGYTGSYESAMVPEGFRAAVLGEILDDNGVLVEDADAPAAHFALLFEFEGDQNRIRHVVYNNIADRPDIESATKAGSIEVRPEKINITSLPIYIPTLDKTIVKARTGAGTDSSVYEGWYSQVYVPSVTD